MGYLVCTLRVTHQNKKKCVNACHQYILILILILGSINNSFFLYKIYFRFSNEKIFEEVNFLHRAGKTKQLWNNIKSLKT